MCISVARQRLGKHISAGANARKNTTSIARQRIGKHAFLRVDVEVSALSAQSGYIEGVSCDESVTRSGESSVEKELIYCRELFEFWSWEYNVTEKKWKEKNWAVKRRRHV
jgi:hypothetical protein